MVLEGGIRRLSGCKHGVVQVSTKYVQIFRMDSAAESFPSVDGLIIQSGLWGLSFVFRALWHVPG